VSVVRALLVDPDVRFGLLLSRYLAEHGWELVAVPDGRDALQRWDEIRPSLVLSEIDGEDMDGLEFMAAVSRLPDPPPVVICTRSPGVRTWDETSLRSLGVASALVRPLLFADLLREIRRVVESSLTGRA
jgi:CheY-like chemotaxis protein